MKTYSQQIASEYNWIDKKIRKMDSRNVSGNLRICRDMFVERQEAIINELSKEAEQ